MGWEMAVVGALGAAQYQQQGVIGKTNQAIQNRNAQVFKQEGDAIEQQAEFDVAAFAKQFKKLQAEQKVATIKSGAELSGTYFKILKSNEREKILQDNIIRYNASIGKARAYERANFATISGQVAKQQAKLAQIGTLTQTGTSLLTMGGGFGASNTAKLNMAYPAQYGTF
jgi:hypothetical protein